MKTLFYTSIYSKLWGTEFGGRPSRNLHYKYSLLSLLKLEGDKYICFTSSEEIDELKNWFYNENSVSSEKLEFIEFNLHDTQYFEDIKKLKNTEEMKQMDRCYEVQYNKFFWLDIIPNLESYDRVFWIDAGLSHGGIFPEKYSYGQGFEKHYNFSVFNKSLKEKLNQITENTILILSKNNTGKFYWSNTIPHNYYNTYDNSEHIIGGMFGGTVKNMLIFKTRFISLLKDLLQNEKSLYFEEHIMSCVYQKYKSFFTTFNFDDWYQRENSTENTIYFYNMFELNKVCICTLAIEISNNSRYIEKTKILIESYLKYTDFDILVLTNKINELNYLKNKRIKLIDYNTNFDEKIISDQRFNMHIKRYPIQLAKKLGYEIIYFHDCDCYIVGWDKESFETKCNEDFDVAFVSHANPQLGGLRANYKHFQDKIDNEFGDLYYLDLDNSPNPAETRVLFKNNEKLNKFLYFWDLISKRNNNYFTYHDGVYFGTSAVYAGMKMIGVTQADKFASFCRISHMDRVLDYFGHYITETPYALNENINLSNEPTIQNSVDSIITGNFLYKGIQVQQNPKIIEVFEEVLREVNPDLIIEIGTGSGGMTLILSDILEKINLPNTKIKSFDIIPFKDNPLLSNLNNVEFLTLNIFQPCYYDLLDEYINTINTYIAENNRVIVLCDGSKNIKEFNVMAKYIKSGDIIMIHDYAKNQEVFDSSIKNKIWNWFEVSESDILESCEKFSLKPFMSDKLESVAWGSKTKNES
jgi:cephalosporin hydroxylase